MKRILTICLAFGFLAVASPSQANIVSNPGFEAGNLSPWVVTAGAVYVDGSSPPYLDVHSGLWAAGFAPGYPTDTLVQNLTTIPGHNYDVNFWLDNTFGSVPLVVKFGGTTLISPPNPLPNTAGYQDFNEIVTATSTTTALSFSVVPQDLSLYQPSLDDVSVTPVPEPTTIIAGAMLLLPFGSRAFRQLRKKL